MTGDRILVYVVTSGVYSSYSIEGVFSDSDLAKELEHKLSKAYGSLDKVRVEKFYLDLPVGDYEVTTVRMTKEGSTLEILHSVGRDTGTHAFDHPGNLLWSIYGKDEKRAVKVANEKRVQLIANNLWGADDSQLEEYIHNDRSK